MQPSSLTISSCKPKQAGVFQFLRQGAVRGMSGRGICAGSAETFSERFDQNLCDLVRTNCCMGIVVDITNAEVRIPLDRLETILMY